ncbi:MAG TPA: flagellar biosynthesis protein FlhF, partial [Paenibacillus sp.]|nr:flagellar biosynthesis protein FlhF [Paenibacillus sp.]
TEERKDTFLVLSLSMKYSDMKAVTDNFYRFGVEKVLFTKADETATFGSVVNLLHDYKLSLSYVTDGQNVPDDINIADARNMANELVGEPHDE